MLNLIGLSKSFGRGPEQRSVFEDINLEIAPGEFVLIHGLSGSGKTTLLHLVGGIEPPTSGKVLLDGESLYEKPEKERARLRSRTFGFIFQEAHLVPGLSVLHNTCLAGVIAGHTPHSVMPEARRCIEEVGLNDLMDAVPDRLSGGQKQRLVIARALINRPRILLADEPTGNLDERTGRRILELLFRPAQNGETHTVLMATHDPAARAYATRAFEIREGRLREESL